MTIQKPPILEPIQPMPPAWAIWFQNLVTAFNNLLAVLSVPVGRVLFGSGTSVTSSDDLTYDGTMLRIGPSTGYTEIDPTVGPVLMGDSTVWKDIVFPIVAKFTGVGNPTYATFKGNIKAPQFSVNDTVDLDASEFIHEWVEATDAHIHLHWTSMTNVAATRAVKWRVEETHVPTTNLGVWTDAQTFEVEVTIPANTPAFTEFITPIATIPIPGGEIGGQIRMKLTRIAASGTAPATSPYATQLGIHLECNTMGSREIANK